MQSVRSLCRSLFSLILIPLSISAVAQGPYEFNGDTSGWTVNNATFDSFDDYSAVMSFSGSSKNNNRIVIAPNGGFDTSASSIPVSYTHLTLPTS